MNHLYDLTKPSPLLMSLPEWEEFDKRVTQTKRIITASTNPRLIVLETHLLIEYVVRHILRGGLGLDDFVFDEFLPLPKSFNECIELIKKIKDDQKKKKIITYRSRNFVSLEDIINFFVISIRQRYHIFFFSCFLESCFNVGYVIIKTRTPKSTAGQIASRNILLGNI